METTRQSATIDSSTETPQDPIDLRKLLNRCLDDPAFATLLLQGFQKDAHRSLNELSASFAQGNSAALKRAAHSLRGAAGALSADKVVDTATRLEQLDVVSEHEVASQCLNQLRGEIQQLLDYVPTALTKLLSA